MTDSSQTTLLRSGNGTLVETPAYGFAHGEFAVTVLSDGEISIPEQYLVSDAPAGHAPDVLRQIGAAGGFVRVAANIPVLRTASDLILIDIGAGHRYQSSDGRFADNLAEAGFKATEVTKVVFTHAHPDHTWATLTEGGVLRYPNATYYIGATEWDFWMDLGRRTSMPAGFEPFAQGAQRDLTAVEDRVVRLKASDEVVPGLRALATPGHTPGHLSFELMGNRETLIIAADVATNQLVSFEHPEWRFGYDFLPELAVRTRVQFLDRAAREGVRLLGYHWAYPGVGYVERRGSAFRYSPV